MSGRDDVNNAIGDFAQDAPMYNGGALPDDIFDGLDDSGDLLREIDELKQQLAERENTALANVDDMRVGRFQMTPTGLIAPDDATPEEFGHVGRILFNLDSSLQWLIGDWLVLVDGYQWGETGKLALHFGRKPQTLYNLKLVAKNVSFSLRKESLSYGHHALVAALDDDQQADWLDKAGWGDADPTDGKRRIKWSISRLSHEIKMSKRPTLPGDITPDLLDFPQKSKEIKRFGRVVSKSLQGDEKSRREALGWIMQHRAWLDSIEETLNDE